MPSNNFLRSPRPIAVAMWDFSWLVRRHGHENDYADWDACLAALRERGYQCVRIDPFPHLIASPAHTFLLPPLPRSFMWGHHTPVSINPTDGLLTFMHKTVEHGLSVGLSSWFLDDAGHQRATLTSAEAFADVWLHTLRVLESAHLLDHVLWVDLCNEFPMSVWAPAAHKRLFRLPFSYGLLPSALTLNRPWGRRARAAISQFITTAITILKRAYPHLHYTFSFQEFGAQNLTQVDLSALDFLEPHIWLSDDLWWSLRSKHYKAALGLRHGVRDHAQHASHLYEQARPYCIDMLRKRLNFWRQLADHWHLPLVTTEGWVSTFYNDLASPAQEWEWFKHLTSEAVTLALEQGWNGICSSNFCQPYFRGFWDDVDWHKRLTNRIHGLEI